MSKRPAKPCKFLLENRCTWGKGCRFSHDIDPASQDAGGPSNSNKPSKGAPHNTKGGRPLNGRAPEASKFEEPVKQVIAESKQREVTNPHGALNGISPLMKDKAIAEAPRRTQEGDRNPGKDHRWSTKQTFEGSSPQHQRRPTATQRPAPRGQQT